MEKELLIVLVTGGSLLLLGLINLIISIILIKKNKDNQNGFENIIQALGLIYQEKEKNNTKNYQKSILLFPQQEKLLELF